jgi:hypothetical protein
VALAGSSSYPPPPVGCLLGSQADATAGGKKTVALQGPPHARGAGLFVQVVAGVGIGRAALSRRYALPALGGLWFHLRG